MGALADSFIMMVFGTRARHAADKQELSVQATCRSSPHQVCGCPPTVKVMFMAVKFVKATAMAESRS